MRTDEDDEVMPLKEFSVVYCDKCGRNDFVGTLSPRHFKGGSFCKGGKLKSVTYKRDDSTIRPAERG